MFKINNIRVELDERLSKESICKKCKIKAFDLVDFKIVKKSVDARKKNDIHYTYSILAELKNENAYLKRKDFILTEEKKYSFPKRAVGNEKIVIVGSGPAGLFAALVLSKAGAKPIIIERGCEVDKRIEDVKAFWNGGKFKKNSNVQFGEGGAGTFSDGKLTTGINDIRLEYIKEQFVKYGAPKEILYSAKPHIGTDKLCITVKNIRNEIIKLGGKFLFNTQLTDIKVSNGRIIGAKCTSGDSEFEIECDSMILAVGHSARDTFEMLKQKGVPMMRKTFSIGARIEHLQSDIGYSQYGDTYSFLPPADYKLAVKTGSGRGVYTFCMCPGGYVVASSSEEDGVVTNGMSYFSRDGKNANSALLVTVEPDDIDGDDVLGGMYLQRDIERKAFSEGGKNYFAPCQRVGDFLHNTVSEDIGKVSPTFKPGVKFCDLRKIFPKFISDSMAEGIVLMDKKLKGFADPNALLTAPETRSSSPVRIIRDETFQSEIKGLYPAGEGAGYAGGIMSAALDGIKCAEAVILNNSQN